MMQYNPKVTIIILNWNAYQETANCIKSLKKSKYNNYNIIIVDNNSNDDSYSLLKNSFPELDFIQSKKNLGYASGNNLGIKRAIENKADLIWILNSDAVVLPDTLEHLINTFNELADVGVAGSVILNSDKNSDKKYHYTYGDINLNKGGQAIHRNEEYLIKSEPYDVGYVNGASIMFKPDVVEKVGLLPEDYFLYYEETEWCYRVRKAGWRVVINPKSRIYQPSYSLYPRQAYYLIRNRFLITRRLNGKGYTYIFLTVYRWVKTFLFKKDKRDKKILVATFVGLIHGVLGKTGRYNI